MFKGSLNDTALPCPLKSLPKLTSATEFQEIPEVKLTLNSVGTASEESYYGQSVFSQKEEEA